MINRLFLALLSGSFLVLSGCGNREGDKNDPDTKMPDGRYDFNTIKDITFYEAKRKFASGLIFNESGFQQEPSWEIRFRSNDTVEVYSPDEDKMFPFYITYDHGQVYNFAKNYFRIMHVSKDSLVFQRLHLKRKEISKGIESDVHMTFYTDAYITKKLKTTLEELRKPLPKDSAYIRELTAKAQRNPGNADSAFAARSPVAFTPVSDMIKVEKKDNTDPVMGLTAYDYMFPRYRIEISKAYKDFGYEFSVVVDENGKIHLGKIDNVIPEQMASRRKTIQAIIDVYFYNLLKISPGTSLGIPHPSEVKIVAVGKTTKK
ncbi:hypothetical protein [Pedobacter faecalis]|uniref:hypothetical protein n=1 Tax=Pedobacter faecalis TaxID=3041495 RepID=UPI00254D9B12|nr:hypothetical protein [Pedobacter sp. ELA7]